ncbi:MAG TPA: hypothetical protein VE129_10850 [Thermoanaerobaculia bacterium]|nr:hypothetical protein [Thermoanaerobaculia bacterium]
MKDCSGQTFGGAEMTGVAGLGLTVTVELPLPAPAHVRPSVSEETE